MTRNGQSLAFKYDHNGMRIQKVLEHSWYTETTNYTYHGKLLAYMEAMYSNFNEVEHTDSFYFFYNMQPKPAKAFSNGETCAYSHNLPSDIVEIVDSIGMLMVEYGCDIWGETLSITGFLANVLGVWDPFRYCDCVLMRRRGCAIYRIVIMRKVTYIPF